MKRTELGWMGSCGQQALLSRRENAAEDGNQPLRCVIAVLAPFLVLGRNISASAEQYTAYSLKIAQQRIEQAGANWREKEPEVAGLGGINKVEGFVFDRASDDLILVGQREEGRAPLALDDLVVALRARFRYNEWPLVSIDPTPDTEKTQMQHVRFEGGIENTAFGKAMFDADYRLKELGMGLAEAGIGSFQTAWDRDVEEIDGGGSSGQRLVSSRFWFYPINPHVTVREGVCVVRGLRVGVFTEVLAAKIDGRTVEDAKAFKNLSDDAFAKDVSERFDDLCRAQPSFNRLRGLQELVAVSKALEELEQRPDLGWWLHRYDVEETETKPEAKVLRRRYDGKRRWFEVSGGVHLTALAMRLKAGDVRALRKAVLSVRPSPGALHWAFVVGEWLIPISPSQLKPEDIAPLFQQAEFVYEQQRYTDALALLDSILQLDQANVEALFNKAVTLGKLNRSQEALEAYEQVIRDYRQVAEPGIREAVAQAMYGKTVALLKLNRRQEEIDAYEQVIREYGYAAEPRIRETVAKTLFNKGMTLGQLNRGQEALAVYEQVIHDYGGDAQPGIREQVARAMLNRGATLGQLSRSQEALEAYEQLIREYGQAAEPGIRESVAKAMFNKGGTLGRLNRSQEAMEAYEQVIREYGLDTEPGIREAVAKTLFNKAVELFELNRRQEAFDAYERVIREYGRAPEPGIREQVATAMFNKGCMLGQLNRSTEALGVFEQVIREYGQAAEPGIRESVANAMFNKGAMLCELKRYGEARQAFQKAADLGFSGAQGALDTLTRAGH